jgi:plasmid stabilization system protein ParE
VKLSIAQSALNDLQDIKIYYKEQGVPEVGMEFVEAIFSHAQSLLQHPDSGRMVPEFEQEHIREIIHPPFRVVYLRKAKTINLVRVWRSERILLLPEDET